jgi:hypothetical protein
MANGVTQEDILSWVRTLVWSGEYDEQEVAVQIKDQLGARYEVDEGWLRNAIRREAESKRRPKRPGRR